MRRSVSLNQNTKKFKAPLWNAESEEVYLEVQGVSVDAKVQLNGKSLIQHVGGYGSFRANITEAIRDENYLEVYGENDTEAVCGDARIVIVNKNHFDMDFYGGIGVQIVSAVTGEDAEVRVKSWHNASDAQVFISILDKEQNTVIAGRGTDTTLRVEKAKLWDGVKNPYLYTAVVQLFVDGQVVDEVHTRFGIRTFEVDAEKGFFLNGHPYVLHGAVRYEEGQNAVGVLRREQHRTDMERLVKMGVNAVRLAKHQHNQYFYDLCDEYGMLVWAEILTDDMKNPMENKEDELQKSKLMLRELITQNYNHPSVVIWGWQQKQPVTWKNKEAVIKFHQTLNELSHKLDSGRLTTVKWQPSLWMYDKNFQVPDLLIAEKAFPYLHNLCAKLFRRLYPASPLFFLKYERKDEERVTPVEVFFYNEKKQK